MSDKRKRVELGSESSLADKDGDGYIEPFNVNPNEYIPGGGGNEAPPVDLTNTDVLQETHYYPFGMTMEGEWQNIVNGPENNYLYNGKELNSDFGLDWSDYGARYYDASIARWNSVDPLAETMASWSPYNYAFNNPILFVDPDGNAPEPPNGGGFSQLTYTFNENYSHTVKYHLETTRFSADNKSATRTIVDETVELSNTGEILGIETLTVHKEAKVEGVKDISNPLDGMEVETTVLGEWKEVESTFDASGNIESLSDDIQGVVSTIQENTEFNSRYDYIGKNAAEENFVVSLGYAAGTLLSKGPAWAKAAGGVLIATSAYNNATKDNRGRTVKTFPKIK